jgi:Spy/CpxP family protein refolding chaperone
MKRSTKRVLVASAAVGLGLVIAAAFAHPGAMRGGMGPGMNGMGPGMMMQGEAGPMGGPMAMQHADASFGDDMQLVHAMLFDHEKIKRSVTNLPDGIRTVTASDDPAVARAIKAHVTSMEKRLAEGRVFNLFSPTLPVLFANKDQIRTIVEMTDTGAVVTQTTADTKVAAALQAHALEVNELARDGMVAMMRGMRARMGH